MLLRFRVANHRSIRDESELSLISSSLRTISPRDGDWAGATTRVAAIYGANASGKSNLLDAIDFAISAIRQSATTWAENDRFPYHPFALTRGEKPPSFYELSVVVDGVRYDYGFRSTALGIEAEWLFSYPESRRRRLFIRNGPDGNSITFSRHLPGENSLAASLVRPRSLFLSAAANSNHRFLQRIHQQISRHILYARYGEFDQQTRLRVAMETISDPDSLELAVSLLRMADVGISGVRVTSHDLSPEARSLLDLILRETRQEDALRIVEEAGRALAFVHSAADGEEFEIPQVDQSSGTLAWMALAVPALQAFRGGDVLLVDELDANLHPHLASALVEMFKNPEINQKGAQIVFTTHDVSFMSPSYPALLEPDEIWFTEKRGDGSTELFSLAEFPTRNGDNFSKRYLDGRYGAVPLLNHRIISEILRQTGTLHHPPEGQERLISGAGEIHDRKTREF
ncbi:ATP/GTP-binding protein [Parafrankia sp. EUN1f]|uniref:AAA family ATPase n=1 Tax=Parafrankia sp. EUN1f TaxID=102897 RepID=UPI0001C467E8|nr:ATP-binding protein [Parafrankia sp. EUN1f]EFC81019.1 SMC domain protein [Parafrankia sp. EUN1f]